jgi:hypothetical protein
VNTYIQHLHTPTLKPEFKLRGDLQIETWRPGDKRPLRRYALRNQITYNGFNSPLYLWSQDSGNPSDWRIVKLVPGTNGTPPTIGDLALGSPLGPADEIHLTAANRTVVPASGELIITGTLTTLQANGHSLREVGLFLGNGQLFARQVYPVIAKTGAITVTYTWRIAVTA